MNEIKKWRNNACMTQKEFASTFEIPIRTIENWEEDQRKPPAYVEKLIIEKLKRITEQTLPERAKKTMAKLKPDENGNRPVGSWATIKKNRNSDDETVECFETMEKAIEDMTYYCDEKDYDTNQSYAAYIICNDRNGRPEPWYTDKNGNVETDHDSIIL